MHDTWTATTISPDRRMIVLAKLKANLGITDAASDDILYDLIDEVSALAESDSGLRRPPWRQSYEMQAVGSDTRRLVIPLWPVEAVDSITHFGSAIDGYYVRGKNHDELYRDSGWPVVAYRQQGVTLDPRSGTESYAYLITLTAGWLMPGQVGAWEATSDYALNKSTSYDGETRGSWVRSANRTVTTRFECTTAGTSGSTEPTAFATAIAGDEIVDGTVTWTARAAVEMPSSLGRGAMLLATTWWKRRAVDPDVESVSSKGTSVTFRSGAGTAISDAVADLWRQWR